LGAHGFCLWLKRLEAERFKTKPDVFEGWDGVANGCR